MKKIETVTPFLLKIGLVLLAFPMLVYVFVGGYIIFSSLFDGVTPWYIYPPFIIIWISAFFYFMGLTQAFHIVVLFQRDQIYTPLTNVKLHLIFKHSLAVGILFGVAIPFWYIIAEIEDAPGLILMALIVTGLCFFIALISVLARQIIEKGMFVMEGKNND